MRGCKDNILACVGGEFGTCNKWVEDKWKNRAVICAGGLKSRDGAKGNVPDHVEWACKTRNNKGHTCLKWNE